ncbi:hypothetical protein FHS27_006570 [Rhodopirellula rubra]|uniref:Uncharacterized protein n=1 Tax=Aporhodopirellula rubra TaxID=980271 RepID=A0A7W5E7G3_9BACT|nr:hypothetical protein [Aporhodopirellula rubra]MBB3210722.1 hypothetical protein [Aporhodopirellula rubra]
MYTGLATPTAAVIAGAIANDAIVLGASDTRAFRFDDWWIISADSDWLNAPCKCFAPPTEAFRRVLAFPEIGVNSMRHEILATAFATSVVSLSPTDRIVVSGDVPDDDPVWGQMTASNVMRAVALRMVA